MIVPSGIATNVPWRALPPWWHGDVMFKRISYLVAAPAAILALAVAGCGGGGSSTPATAGTNSNASSSSSSSSSGMGQVLKLSADPGGQLRFNTAKLTASKPGTVTLQMTNPSSAGMPHGIAIEGNGVDRDGPIVDAGKTSTVTVKLKKGTYTYYCPVPGHLQAGMKGILTVR
jgi:plastocyanin